MRERPILLHQSELRALRHGYMTQVRRPVYPQHLRHVTPEELLANPDQAAARSPFGGPGDQLWVRETWRLWEGPSITAGLASDSEAEFDLLTGRLVGRDPDWLRRRPVEYYAETFDDPPWRSAAVMPRWASRYQLAVDHVHVQRLHDMTLDDATAEGVCDLHPCPWPQLHIDLFRARWQTHFKKRAAWEDNPLVWAITFRVLRSERAPAW